MSLPTLPLTPRESQVLDAIVNGHCRVARQIKVKLDIKADDTVYSHLRTLKRKFKVTNMTDLLEKGREYAYKG